MKVKANGEVYDLEEISQLQCYLVQNYDFTFCVKCDALIPLNEQKHKELDEVFYCSQECYDKPLSQRETYLDLQPKNYGSNCCGE